MRILEDFGDLVWSLEEQNQGLKEERELGLGGEGINKGFGLGMKGEICFGPLDWVDERGFGPLI